MRIMPGKRLTGLRFFAFVGGFLGFIGLALYPIAVAPMINAEKYKKIQAVTRRDINQENVQPGNMKVWSDPFGRKKVDDS